MTVKLKLALVMGLCLLTLSSCLFVSVETESGQVEAVFTRAREEILGLTLSCSISEKPGKFKMLVYDPEEAQLVRITLPLWLVRKGLRQEIEQTGSARRQDFEFDVKAFNQAIQQLPRGLVAEVWTDREKMLLWLE
jgi:hypothetical protein